MPELPIEKLEEDNAIQKNNENEPFKEDNNNQQSTQMPKKTLTRMMTMAKRGSIIMKSNPLDELEDEKDDGKKETLFFNKGKKVNF